jgi:dihydrofolate reductase
MILSAIVAVSRNNAIGKDNQLPWHLPEDLKFFKRTTMGKPILMGRKTYESMGRPLKGRLNIVISTQQDLKLPEEILLFNSLNEGMERMEAENAEEGFIIGGGQIFAETLNELDRIYLTKVDTVIEDANAFFPEIDHAHWKVVWEEAHEADEKHQYRFVIQQLERIDL